MGLLYAAVIGFFLFLIGEWLLVRLARKRFDLVIHVNGTRGKSTVTRMIHTLLRANDMEVFGKTTGSAARLLLPDGTEKPVLRFGPANIREQRNVMIASAFTGTRKQRALVFECNAVKEELQYTSMEWLQPDITVITNVRDDHTDELGSMEQAARIFAAAVPGNSSLVTSECAFAGVWETAALQKNLRLCYVDPQEAADFAFPENAACVLGVADLLGIDRNTAEQSIAAHKPDIGAFTVYRWKENDRAIFFADARAANDIESTQRLFTAASQTVHKQIADFEKAENCRRILLVINREDRPDRSEMFMRYIAEQHRKSMFDEYVCIGHAPLAFRDALKRENVPCKITRNIRDFQRDVFESSQQPLYIFAVGNFGGKGKQVTQWLAAKQRLPDCKAEP
ncbi:MAG: poly-gamma-glutamate synthase PgsB [Treponema sp.]|nr:poly-gamma-glutamate synthase PgsB [Treponema sp.]